MFDDLKLAPKDEDEMEDFRDYDDESDDVDSKLDDYEDDEDDDDEEDLLIDSCCGSRGAGEARFGNRWLSRSSR